MNIRETLLCLLLLLGGCASQPNPYWPTADEAKTSVKHAARDPATWVPILGTALVVATHSDQHVSDWASSKQPLFGAHTNRVADDGRNALGVLAYGTLLLSPQLHPEMPWYAEKAKNVLALYAAHAWADGATGALKGLTGRERPSGRNNQSFPSGHATSAAAYAAEAVLNLDHSGLSPTALAWSKAGIYLLSTGVAWARVEAKAHYPTDVLMGLALGNFVGAAGYSAFLHAGLPDAQLVITPLPGGALLSIYSPF